MPEEVQRMENANHQTAKWKPLYRAGAVAPLIALAFYLIEFSLLILGEEPYPTTIEGWYAIFQRSKLLGLWYLNALDIISFALLGVMFLALYVALRRIHPSWMLIALYFALLGVAVFIVPRVLHLSLLSLSDLHAAATTEAQRATYLAAGEALSQVSSATPQTLGFLFTAFAGLIISVVVLRNNVKSHPFGKAVAYVGIAGFVAALVNYIARLLAPDIAPMLMPINGLLWFAWWIMISVGLFKLVKTASSSEGRSRQ
jgi:FtsH-binding integral membrane protein